MGCGPAPAQSRGNTIFLTRTLGDSAPPRILRSAPWAITFDICQFVSTPAKARDACKGWFCGYAR